jgi:hypothetical protein
VRGVEHSTFRNDLKRLPGQQLTAVLDALAACRTRCCTFTRYGTPLSDLWSLDLGPLTVSTSEAPPAWRKVYDYTDSWDVGVNYVGPLPAQRKPGYRSNSYTVLARFTHDCPFAVVDPSRHACAYTVFSFTHSYAHKHVQGIIFPCAEARALF